MIYAPISAVGVLMVFSASYFTAAGLLVCVPMDEHRDFINDTRFDYYKEDYAIITVNPIIYSRDDFFGHVKLAILFSLLIRDETKNSNNDFSRIVMPV